MTENAERHAAQHGYTLVELQAGRAGDLALAEERAQDLRRRLDGLQAEIGQVHGQVIEVEREVRSAVEAEDAERTAGLWNKKHRLLDRIAELQREQLGAQQQLQSEIKAALTELGRERAEIEQDAARQDEDWRQLLKSVEALREEVLEADRRRNDVRLREASFRTKLESLAGRELRVLTDATLEPAPGAHRRLRPAPEPATTGDHAAVGRIWSVYDVDSGKLVSTLAELTRVLVRWYPKLHSHEERVREFLTEPNATPMPDRLRREIEAAGYLKPPD
jgi:chromosome segregation ATPase